MDVKIDVGDVVGKSTGVLTRFGAFWKGMAFPDNFGPALSFLIVLGILPLVGNFLSGIIPMPTPFGWISFGIMYGVWTAVLGYVFFVGMPLLMGVILGAIDPAMNINKAQAPAYATALAYATVPAAIGSFFSFLPYLNIIVGLVLWVFALIITYLAFTEGIGMDSGQAIIMMVIMAVIVFVLYAIIFMFLVGILMGGAGFWGWGRPY